MCTVAAERYTARFEHGLQNNYLTFAYYYTSCEALIIRLYITIFFLNSFRNGIFSSPFRKRPILIFMLLPSRAIKTAVYRNCCAIIIVRYNYGVFVSISIPIREVYPYFIDEHHSRSIGFSRPVISVYLAGITRVRRK